MQRRRVLLLFASAAMAACSTSASDPDGGVADAAADVPSYGCCQGDACGYPPAADGTCLGPQGPSRGVAGFTPADLTTRTAATSLTFGALSGGSIASADGLGITLLTYPELAPVDASTTLVDGVIAITPAAPLDDRWYVTSIASAPEGWSLLPPMPADPRLGPTFARFRPGSAPVRRSVAICQKGANVARVVLQLSEPIDVAFAQTSAITVTDLDSGAACPFTPGGTVTAEDQLFFDCASAPTKLRVTCDGTAHAPLDGGVFGVFMPDASTSDGVVDTQPRTDDLDFTSAPDDDGCKVLYR